MSNFFSAQSQPAPIQPNPAPVAPIQQSAPVAKPQPS